MATPKPRRNRRPLNPAQQYCPQLITLQDGVAGDTAHELRFSCGVWSWTGTTVAFRQTAVQVAGIPNIVVSDGARRCIAARAEDDGQSVTLTFAGGPITASGLILVPVGDPAIRGPQGEWISPGTPPFDI